jgi:hypothetical protein
MNKEAVAKVCHETNRAYCQTIGDNSQPEWENAPQWQRDSAIKGVDFHLLHLRAGNNPPASASHNAWLYQKRQDGWKYGPIKDVDKKEHPCFVPYKDLSVEQRLKDYLFGAVVRAYFEVNNG